MSRTRTSKAVLFHELGGPEVLRVEEVPTGEPGPDELLIRVDAFGLNRAEAHFREGTYFYRPTLPGSRNGYEAAGVVEAVGPGVTHFAPGDTVSTYGGFALSRHGVYAERAVVPASSTLHRPEAIDTIVGASVWLAYGTAYGALAETVRVQPGDTVLITAGSSGVGLAAIQIVNALGATPLVTTRTGAKRERLLTAGAAQVIALDEGDLAERVRATTGGRGADVVFDSVAGPGLAALTDALVPGSDLIVYGWMDESPAPLPRKLPLTIHNYALSATMADPRARRRLEHFISTGLRAGVLEPVVDRIFEGLDRTVEAHRYMESNQQFGKIVVTVAH